MTPGSHRLLNSRTRIVLWIVVAVGVLVFFSALLRDPARAWHNLLLHNFFFLSLSVLGVVFICTQYLAKAGWSVVLRRVPEAMASYLPIGALLMLTLYFGLDSVYEWTDADLLASDAVLKEKAAYLNVPAFYARLVLILAAWTLFARRIVGNSRRQDLEADPRWTGRNVVLSGAFGVVFALTYSVAAIDWLMSLEAHWHSTLFPWYVASSMFVSALAAMTVMTVVLYRAGHLPEVNEHHLHDLGKLVFAFSIFWAYLWFSQYMLTWYTNIPEEIIHYDARTGPWFLPFALNPIVNLGVPFLMLPAAFKKNLTILTTLCVIVIAGHWFDIYLLVMPKLFTEGPYLGLTEIGVGAGVAAGFVLSCNRALSHAPITPENDPYLLEAIHHHG